MNQKISHKTERIHSLDSLRAIMMLLGLVLHSAVTYTVSDMGEIWTLKDPVNTHISNDLLVVIIHLFRMPIFFFIAGFFGSLLFYERSPLKMFKNRVSRIVYPFAIFLFILSPLIIITFLYSNYVFAGNEAPLITTLSWFSNSLIFIPGETYHLWFLYYLFLISMVTLVLGLLLKKTPYLTTRVTKGFNWIIHKPFLRIFFFSLLTFILYLLMDVKEVESSTSFIPDLKTFLFCFQFYIIGWIFFKSKHLLDRIMQLDWIQTIFGVIITSVIYSLNESLKFEVFVFFKSFSVWLFVFGITGLFIRYGSKHSTVMRYISDSSYWVYLIHLPITLVLPGLIGNWALPATIKFLIVLATTTCLCFISYHYFVRDTFIGVFLNGRKYPKTD